MTSTGQTFTKVYLFWKTNSFKNIKKNIIKAFYNKQEKDLTKTLTKHFQYLIVTYNFLQLRQAAGIFKGIFETNFGNASTL